MASACACGVHGKGKSVPVGKSRREYRRGSRSTAALSPQELQIRGQPKSSPPLTSPYALLLSGKRKKKSLLNSLSHPTHLGNLSPQRFTKKKKKSRINSVALGITQSHPPRSTLLWPACLSMENAWSQTRTEKQKSAKQESQISDSNTGSLQLWARGFSGSQFPDL